MARQEHLDILQQGVDFWNQWRKERRDIKPDLSGADLSNAQLDDVRLSFSQLAGTDFSQSQLQRAYFVSSDLSTANFNEAQFTEGHLDSADLRGTNLRNTNLQRAKIRDVRLQGADLSGADLSFSTLYGTSFRNAILRGTDLSFTKIRFADFFHTDLSTAKGLDTIIHSGPSHIGIQTLSHSLSSLPASFLEGANVPETMLTYVCDLQGNAPAYHTCLLSYASADQRFAQELQVSLQARGVLCESQPYNLEIEEVRKRYARSLTIYDTLVLMISEHSETEQANRALNFIVKNAIISGGKDSLPVFLPIHLNKSPDKMRGVWARLIGKLAKYQSQDFTAWNEHSPDQTALIQLLHTLQEQPK